MPNDEFTMWEEAAQDLQPPKVLAKIYEHQKFVVSTVSTVGTLLAGLGGVTAAITITRTTTYWNGVPVVPACALLVSFLAGLAVVVSLVARRPRFDTVNTNNMSDVRTYILGEIDRNKNTLKVSSGLLLAAAIAAVVTSLGAGISTIAEDEGPRNQTSLSAAAGKGGAVTITLAGAVDRLYKDQFLSVQISSPSTDGHLADLTVHPDAAGKATLSAAVQAPAASTTVNAVITVRNSAGQQGASYTLSATFAAVPTSAATTPS